MSLSAHDHPKQPCNTSLAGHEEVEKGVEELGTLITTFGCMIMYPKAYIICCPGSGISSRMNRMPMKWPVPVSGSPLLVIMCCTTPG